MAFYYNLEVGKKGFIVKEHNDQARYDLMPFFGDMCTFIKVAFESFDNYINYDLEQVTGNLWGGTLKAKKAKNKESSNFFLCLKKHSMKVERKPWSLGQEKEWHKYLFFFKDKQDFWKVVKKFEIVIDFHV